MLYAKRWQRECQQCVVHWHWRPPLDCLPLEMPPLPTTADQHRLHLCYYDYYDDGDGCGGDDDDGGALATVQ